MYYYAVAYAYGWAVWASGRVDRIHRFVTKAERDAWVQAGPAITGPGYRLSLRARHQRVRRVNREPHYWEA